MPTLLAIISAIAVVGAVNGSDHEEAFRLRENSEILPFEELLRRAGLIPDPRVLEIEYRSRDGRAREVHIDVVSGEILKGWH